MAMACLWISRSRIATCWFFFLCTHIFFPSSSSPIFKSICRRWLLLFFVRSLLFSCNLHLHLEFSYGVVCIVVIFLAQQRARSTKTSYGITNGNRLIKKKKKWRFIEIYFFPLLSFLVDFFALFNFIFSVTRHKMCVHVIQRLKFLYSKIIGNGVTPVAPVIVGETFSFTSSKMRVFW